MIAADSSIAVCIVSYRRPNVTQRCIESVRATTVFPYRIFLVDNGSPDTETQTLLSTLEGSPDITLFRLDRNRGPSAGRNAALAALPAEYSYVAMFDNDIVALPGWDRAAVRALRAGADLVQPKLLEKNGHTVERGPNRPNPSPLAANPEFIGRGSPMDHPDVNQEEIAAIVGTAAVIRRDVMAKIGTFDEQLQIGEDYDLSFRARDAGFSLRYVPDCVLIHDHGFDLDYDQERGRTEKYLVAHVVFWRKWKKALLSPAYLRWFDWLHRHSEPMYLPAGQRWSIAHRRIRRRLVRKWCMTRYANVWTSEQAADRETRLLATRLGV